MSERIYTNIEPLQNIQRGLMDLQDHIRPIEQQFKKVIDEYDREISESLGSIDKENYENMDEEDRLKKLEQKKADLQEIKAACVAYLHAKEEFLRALHAFCATEGYASDGGISILEKSIAALENYLRAGSGGSSSHVQSRETVIRTMPSMTVSISEASTTDDSDEDNSGPVLRKGPSELWTEGNRAIDRTIEVLRDDLTDKGYDNLQIQRILGEHLIAMREELSRDIENCSPTQQYNIGTDQDDFKKKTR